MRLHAGDRRDRKTLAHLALKEARVLALLGHGAEDVRGNRHRGTRDDPDRHALFDPHLPGAVGLERAESAGRPLGHLPRRQWFGKRARGIGGIGSGLILDVLGSTGTADQQQKRCEHGSG